MPSKLVDALDVSGQLKKKKKKRGSTCLGCTLLLLYYVPGSYHITSMSYMYKVYKTNSGTLGRYCDCNMLIYVCNRLDTRRSAVARILTTRISYSLHVGR